MRREYPQLDQSSNGFGATARNSRSRTKCLKQSYKVLLLGLHAESSSNLCVVFQKKHRTVTNISGKTRQLLTWKSNLTDE